MVMCVTVLSFETSSHAVACIALFGSLLQIRMSDDALDFNRNFKARGAVGCSLQLRKMS